MNFEDANLWCMDHKVEVASSDNGRTLTLRAHGVAVSDPLADGSWQTWKATFIDLVIKLRSRLPPGLGNGGKASGGAPPKPRGGQRSREQHAAVF